MRTRDQRFTDIAPKVYHTICIPSKVCAIHFATGVVIKVRKAWGMEMSDHSGEYSTLKSPSEVIRPQLIFLVSQRFDEKVSIAWVFFFFFFFFFLAFCLLVSSTACLIPSFLTYFLSFTGGFCYSYGGTYRTRDTLQHH